MIPLATQHYMLLQRNLIYTGIARGKRLLVLIGQRRLWASRSATTVRRGGIRDCLLALEVTGGRKLPIAVKLRGYSWRQEGL